MVFNPLGKEIFMKRSADPLFAEPKKRRPWLGFLALLLVFIVAVALALNHLNNSRVNLERQNVTIPSLPASLENFKILHISDLHGLLFGANQERLWAAVRSQKFDIVCVTGDVTGRDGDVTAFLKLIDLFQGVAPVYFIPGDEDPAPLLSTPHGYNNAKAEYILRAEAQGAIYLDAPQKIVRGNGVIWLCPEWIYSLDADASETALNARRSELLGQAESEARQAALIAVEYQLDQLRRVREARREITSGDIHIALTHHPLQLSAMENLQEFTQTDNASYVRTVSLVLAGHYVNGQWRLPWVGPVRVPESAGLGQNGWFPGDRGVSGLSYFLGIPQYISPGLGASAAIGLPPFRLFNTPAVTILNLTVKLTQD